MRYARSLVICAALLALLPVSAGAQTNPVFSQPFQYTDRDGTGVMTITPTGNASTQFNFQPIQVTVDQNQRRFTGSGVYHSFSDDGANLPPRTLVAFTLLDSAGRAYFFQGVIAPAVTGAIAPPTEFVGEGTYYLVSSPQNVIQWQIRSAPTEPPAEQIVNSSPVLRQGWQQNAFEEAIGGTYFSTWNSVDVAVSTATWQGGVPRAGRYKVEVFIPRQPRAGSAPRTNQATYQIIPDGPAANPIVARLSQNVTTSQWMDLGTYEFQQAYRVLLTDQTGEPSFTRSVVANAVRLTPAL